MSIQNIILFLTLVTLITYVFMPWSNNKKGSLIKPGFKDVLIYWLFSAVVSGVIIFLIANILI